MNAYQSPQHEDPQGTKPSHTAQNYITEAGAPGIHHSPHFTDSRPSTQRWQKHQALASNSMAVQRQRDIQAPAATGRNEGALQLKPTTQPNQPAQPVVQRLKVGDFEELNSLGLNVGNWIEFAEAVNKLSWHACVMASRMLEMRKKGDDMDNIRAKLLIDRRKYSLHKPKSRILEHYFGPEPTGNGSQQVQEEREQEIVVGDGVAETARIRSASDMLVWLASHPTGSAKTPRDWSNPQTMALLMTELYQKTGIVSPPEVWKSLRTVLDDEYETPQDLNWSKGDWAQVQDKDTQLTFDEAGRYKRAMPAQKYRAALQNLAQRLRGYQLVGIHATTIESMGSLVIEGVSQARFGTGNGSGKGEGFYVVPTTGRLNKTIKDTALSWGSHFVAVFLPDDCEQQWAADGENVQTLEQEKAPQDRLYYMFGQMEAVIPPSLCDEIILAQDPADISMADPQYEAEIDNGDTFDFVGLMARLVQ